MKHELPHKYEKRDLGVAKPYMVQHCALKSCTHYLSMTAAIGKESLCWKCDKPFILTRLSARLKQPRCLDCKEVRDKRVKAVDQNALAAALGRMVKS